MFSIEESQAYLIQSYNLFSISHQLQHHITRTAMVSGKKNCILNTCKLICGPAGTMFQFGMVSWELYLIRRRENMVVEVKRREVWSNSPVLSPSTKEKMHSEPSIPLSSVQLGRVVKAVSTYSFQWLGVCVEEDVLYGSHWSVSPPPPATAGREQDNVPVIPP